MLAGLERFAEAEPLSWDSYGHVKDARDTPGERVHEALERVVILYEAWNKPDQAAE